MKNTAESIEKHRVLMQQLRTRVPDGPWMKEPDRVEFQHAGLTCLLSRNLSFVWCGYVGIAKGHPAYGRSYDAEELNHLEVHGGLTYANPCGGHICHVTDDDSEAPLFWFGFDCHHGGDLSPTSMELYQKLKAPIFIMKGEKYRDIDYVTAETKSLAEQLSAMVF